MRNRTKAALIISASIASLAVATSASSQEAPPPSARSSTEPDAARLEDVIVTAGKRSERLRDVPFAVTAVGSEALERQRIDRFEDLIGLVPGFNAETQQPGNTRLTLRGLDAGGASATVAVYVDETPYGSSTGLANAATLSADMDTFDLDRVEVLRGPQGTLYGASALGGVVKYVTRAPRLGVYEGAASLGAETIDEGGTGFTARGALNIPLGDRAAIRATGFHRRDAGFIDDPARGRTDVNDSVVNGGRIALLVQPNDRLELRATAAFQDLENDATPEQDVDPVTLRPIIDDLAQSREIDPSSDVAYRIYSLGAEYDLGWGALTSNTSFGRFDQARSQDFTTSAGGTPSVLFGGIEHERFSQELRLASTGDGPLDWLIGAYYTKEKALLGLDLVFLDAEGQPQPGDPFITIRLPSDYEELSAFGSLTYAFTPRFSVTAGLRVSENDQIASQTGAPESRSSDRVATYALAPRFEVSDDLTIYARIATGYRPGGPNLVLPDAGVPLFYEPDEVMNYEVGFKGELADGLLSYDVAAFWIDWTDIQLLADFGSGTTNANGGTAFSRGVEVAAELRPMEGLTLGLAGAYTDARLTEETGPPLNAVDGDRLPFAPRWAGSVSADYEWSAGNGATAYVGGTWRYVGDRFSQFDQIIGQTALPSYDTINLRTGVEFGRYEVQLYARNVDDARGITNLTSAGSVPGGGLGAALIRPRSFGLVFNASF